MGLNTDNNSAALNPPNKIIHDGLIGRFAAQLRMLAMIRLKRCHYHHQHNTRHARPMKRAMFKMPTVLP